MSSGIQTVTETHAMCCVCFEWFAHGELWVDRDGQKWDMCVECGTGVDMPRKPPEGGFQHGSSGYDNYGCRCDVCKEGNRDKQAALRERNSEERQFINGMWIHPLAPHGTRNGYQYYKCRCNACRDAVR